jgi:signal transduction histidine kinase/pSer/pThr/pTyr-binding forkhead associated (FHA) protein
VASFYVIQGNDQGQYFELLETTSTIGRAVNNHVRLQDAKVSRCHAHVLCTEDRFHLIDNNSTNGVYLNGRREKNCILNNGDQIRLGHTLLCFTQAKVTSSGMNEHSDHSQLSTQRSIGTNGASGTNRTNRTIDQAKANKTNLASAESGVSDEVSAQYRSELSCTKNSDLPAISAHLDMLYHTLSATSRTLETETLLQQILKQTAEWLTVDQGCIFLYDSELQQLVPKTQMSSSGNIEKAPEQPLRLTVNWSVIETVMKRQEGILTTEKCTENNRNQINGNDQMIHELLCVPMSGHYGLAGIIYINTPPHSVPENTVLYRYLTQDHLRIMVTIARQTALAIENRRLYQKMIQTEHLATTGQTVSTLSHHIKNILQGIDGGSYLIRTGINNHDENLIQQGWNIVEKNQKRISQLILDILTLSKEREPDYKLEDITETIADAVELLQFRAREENVEMTFKAETMIPKFFFDAEQIHRAVTNLITNGIDAAKTKRDQTESNVSETDTNIKIRNTISDNSDNSDNSDKKCLLGLLWIHVDYCAEKSMVLIRVDDNGFGIPKPLYQELFHAFYSQKKGQGTGLGLSVARKIVQEHGGKIRVTDSPLGGARFEIELPTNRNSE